MNKAFNLHIYCKNSNVVKTYLDVLNSAIIQQKDSAIQCIQESLYCSAELYLNKIKILDTLHEQLLSSYREIKELGFEVEDNGETQPEATDN